MMGKSSSELISKGKLLARPSLHLVKGLPGAMPIGYWKSGPGIISPPEGAWEHWLSVRCDWLASLGMAKPGWLSVYVSDDSSCECAAVWGVASEPSFAGKQVLSGLEKPSYPPLCVLDNEESPAVDRIAAEAYEKFYFEHYLMFEKNPPAAVLGGWQMLWPEDDTLHDHGERLTLMTLWDSEPWIEVWPNGDLFQAIWRLT